MGTIPELDGIIFPSSPGSVPPQALTGRRPAGIGATPELDGTHLPEHFGMGAHDGGICRF